MYSKEDPGWYPSECLPRETDVLFSGKARRKSNRGLILTSAVICRQRFFLLSNEKGEEAVEEPACRSE